MKWPLPSAASSSSSFVKSKYVVVVEKRQSQLSYTPVHSQLLDADEDL
jgi:hypothetical protein